MVVVGDGGGGVLVLLFPGLNTGLLLPEVIGWILLGLDSLGNGTSTALLSSVVGLLEPVKGLTLLDDVVGFGTLLISPGAGVDWVVVVVILIVVAGVVVTGVDVVVTTGIGSGLIFCTAVGLKSSVDTLTGTGDDGGFWVTILSGVDFCWTLRLDTCSAVLINLSRGLRSCLLSLFKI